MGYLFCIATDPNAYRFGKTNTVGIDINLDNFGLPRPREAKIIQVDINPDRIGLTKPVSVGICGDAKQVAHQILLQLSPSAGDTDREERKAIIHQTKSAWAQADLV